MRGQHAAFIGHVDEAWHFSIKLNFCYLSNLTVSVFYDIADVEHCHAFQKGEVERDQIIRVAMYSLRFNALRLISSAIHPSFIGSNPISMSHFGRRVAP